MALVNEEPEIIVNFVNLRISKIIYSTCNKLSVIINTVKKCFKYFQIYAVIY